MTFIKKKTLWKIKYLYVCLVVWLIVYEKKEIPWKGHNLLKGKVYYFLLGAFADFRDLFFIREYTCVQDSLFVDKSLKKISINFFKSCYNEVMLSGIYEFNMKYGFNIWFGLLGKAKQSIGVLSISSFVCFRFFMWFETFQFLSLSSMLWWWYCAEYLKLTVY